MADFELLVEFQNDSEQELIDTWLEISDRDNYNPFGQGYWMTDVILGWENIPEEFEKLKSGFAEIVRHHPTMLSQLKCRGITWKERWIDKNDWQHMEVFKGLVWICTFSDSQEIHAVKLNRYANPPFTEFEIEEVIGKTVAGWLGECI